MNQKLLALAVVSTLAMGASTVTVAATSYTPFANASITTAGKPGHAALIGYCTVQESMYFGADFRMAQPPSCGVTTRCKL